MKRYMKTLAAAFVLALAVPALAQVTGPVGQNAGGAIDPTAFAANTDSAGFNPGSLTPAAVALATSTAQATFARGAVLTGQVITTENTNITTCSATTGFTLPAVGKFKRIQLINRSGGSCLIWPSVGATLETAVGTVAAANAPFTMLTVTNVAFCPITSTAWVQCQ